MNLSLLGLSAALLIPIVLVSTFLVFADYRRTLDTNRADLVSIARLLKQSIESSLTIADLRVRPVVDRVAAFAPRDPRAAEVALGDWLRAQVEDIDQIESFVLIQPDGDVVWATADALIGLNLADRDYFGESLAGPPEGYALGVPVMSRGTNRRVVPIAWPVRTRSGLIVAVVASALGENYFEGLLSAVEDERDVAIEMTTRTGQTAFASHDIPRTTVCGFLLASRQRNVPSASRSRSRGAWRWPVSTAGRPLFWRSRRS